MRVYKLDGEAIAKDQKISLAFDAHKESLHATALGPEGEVVYRESIPYEQSHVKGLIGRFPGCDIEATYEAGPTGYKLLEWLEEEGCQAFMTPPSKVKQDKGGKQLKTDARDSLDLAKQLRADMLKEVHHHGRGHYRQRELTRTREQLVSQRTATCNRIKSKLLYHGIEVPDEINATWSNDFLDWLEDGPSGNRWLDVSIEVLTANYRELSEHIRRLEVELKKLACCEAKQVESEPPDGEERFGFAGWVELLKTVPGIGLLSAMILVLELGDIRRFETAEKFASFLGLVPGEWSSGQTQLKGSLTRWGNRRARTVLVEASWKLIGKDERMGEVYERIKAKSGSGPAICAVARRLGLAIRAMIRDQKPYQSNHPSTQRKDVEHAGNRPPGAAEQTESQEESAEQT